MTEAEKTEQKQMQDNLKNLFNSDDEANHLLAIQLMKGIPEMFDKRLERLFIAFVFLYELYSPDELWWDISKYKK